jgi:hypothetical protein
MKLDVRVKISQNATNMPHKETDGVRATVMLLNRDVRKIDIKKHATLYEVRFKENTQ